MDISCIVIGRNSEATLAGCLKSIKVSNEFRLKDFPGGIEIVYVDSDSSDSSVEVASSYGCKVVRLTGDHMSASAGRYWGAHFGSGDIYQFVDSDMILDKEWFRDALSIDAPCVIGRRRELHISDDQSQLVSEDFYGYKHLERVNRIGGFSLIKSSYMHTYSFNPFLKMEEEGDLVSKLFSMGNFFVVCNSISGFTHLNYRFSKRGLVRNYFQLEFRNDLLLVLINSIVSLRFRSIYRVQFDYLIVSIAFFAIVLSLVSIKFFIVFLLAMCISFVRRRSFSFLLNLIFYPIKIFSLHRAFRKKEIVATCSETVSKISGSFFDKKYR